MFCFVIFCFVIFFVCLFFFQCLKIQEKKIFKAFKDAGEGLIELRKIEAAEEIADRMAKSKNVVYLPGNQNTLFSLPTI